MTSKKQIFYSNGDQDEVFISYSNNSFFHFSQNVTIIFLWCFILNAYKSLLHHFISKGNYEQVSILLDNGADTAAPQCKIIPPLHFAINLKQNDCVKLLLDSGADPNLKTQSGATPLITAVAAQNMTAVKLLLERPIDPNDTNNNVYYFRTYNVIILFL